MPGLATIGIRADEGAEGRVVVAGSVVRQSRAIAVLTGETMFGCQFAATTVAAIGFVAAATDFVAAAVGGKDGGAEMVTVQIG